jgi:hypothetical protein
MTIPAAPSLAANPDRRDGYPNPESGRVASQRSSEQLSILPVALARAAQYPLRIDATRCFGRCLPPRSGRRCRGGRTSVRRNRRWEGWPDGSPGYSAYRTGNRPPPFSGVPQNRGDNHRQGTRRPDSRPFPWNRPPAWPLRRDTWLESTWAQLKLNPDPGALTWVRVGECANCLGRPACSTLRRSARPGRRWRAWTPGRALGARRQRQLFRARQP